MPITSKACSATAGSESHSDRMYSNFYGRGPTASFFKLHASRQHNLLASHYQNQNAAICCQHNHGYLDLLSRPAWWTSCLKLDEESVAGQRRGRVEHAYKLLRQSHWVSMSYLACALCICQQDHKTMVCDARLRCGRTDIVGDRSASDMSISAARKAALLRKCLAY